MGEMDGPLVKATVLSVDDGCSRLYARRWVCAEVLDFVKQSTEQIAGTSDGAA